MLEDIREKSQGLTAKIILGLIILTFAVAGVGSYTNSVDTSVATVNGEAISQQDFNKAYQAQRNRMAQQFGEMFETLSNDSNYMANFRQGVLDNLINERLIDQSSNTLAIRVSDERLKESIRQMPEFQVDGAFDNNRYLAIINQAGFYQSSDFRDYLRVEMTRRQLSQAIMTTEFNLPYQEKLQTELQNQTRDVRFAVVTSEQFKESVDVSEEEIKDYYLANQRLFENKEQVKVDYISLNVTDIAKGIELTNEDVAQYYQENLADFTQNEKRRVAHILVEFNDDESAAKASAESILGRLNQGEDFAVLAKELSHDTFSGESGGDLDWLEPGVMEASFDEAAIALTEVGQVSSLVKTSFGFHIIKLTDFHAEQIQPLTEVQAQLFDKLSHEKAQDKFFALQQDLARVSFEFPDSLDDAANEVNASIQTSPWFTRTGTTTPFNHQKVIEAAFSDLVLQDNLNSDIIEVNDNLAVVLRLNTFQQANVKPLEEVSTSIKTTLIAQKATVIAQKTMDDLLTEFKTGTDITEQLTALSSSFVSKEKLTRYSSEVNQSISKAAFVLPHPKEGIISASTTSLSNGDLALIEVISVQISDGNTSPELAQQQTSQLAQSAYKSFVDSLKVDAEITRKSIAETTASY